MFDNGDERILDLKEVINDKYREKILSPDIFKKAQIGSFGEIFWKDMGAIKNLNGDIESCDYDISSDFAYMKSVPHNSQLSSV